jgi:hypothetical protein
VLDWGETASFPAAAHDDMLDCLTQAIRRHGVRVGQGITIQIIKTPE